MCEAKTPKVFISYEWQNSDRVLELADRLMHDGVNVILDKWDLKVGQDKYAFMEQSVNNPEVDKVLIICDKAYTEKANARQGGVGDETAIISAELYGNVEQNKFIPIIFEVDEDAKPYCPAYIKSRIFINLSSEDEQYETNYEALLRNIHNKPLYRKPSLGAMPEWLENESIDLSEIRDLVKQIHRNTGGNEKKTAYLVRKCSEEFVKAFQSMPDKEGVAQDDVLLAKIEAEKTIRDLYIDYLDSIIYSGFPIETTVPAFFELVYNSTHDASEMRSYSDREFEFYDFVIWELLICTTAILLHYEKFLELYQVLTHTYFLRQSFFDNNLVAYNYTKFRTSFRTIEQICKPKCYDPKLYTLAGDILTHREKKPTITNESLSNADIVLYQLSQVYEFEHEGSNVWFPLAYVYCHTNQPLWYKMKSRVYCEKIMPLLGVTTIDELKEKIEKCKIAREMRYPGTFEPAPTIATYITPKDIATSN